MKEKPPRRETCSSMWSFLGDCSFNEVHSDPSHYWFMVNNEKVYSVTSMILIQWSISATVQKSKVSSGIQDNLLTITSYIFWKQVTSFQHTMAQNTINIPKEKNGDAGREDWTKVRLKQSRTNIKSCSSLLRCVGFSFKWLKWPHPCNFSCISLFGNFHSLWGARSPWKLCHNLGFLRTLGLKCNPVCGEVTFLIVLYLFML